MAGWRWAFFINVPIGLAMLAIGRRVLDREAAEGLRAGADYLGALLLVGGLGATIVAVVDPDRRSVAVLAVVLLAGFVARQLRADRPLLQLRGLMSRSVVGANLVLAILAGSMLGFQYLVTLFFQSVLHYTPAQSGVAILPIACGIGFLSLVVYPRISQRTGPRVLVVPGMLIVALGMFLLVFAPIDASYGVDVLPSMVLFAIGGGIAIPAIMSTAMSATTPDAAGAASGLLSTSQQVGSAIGLAVLSSIAAATTSRLASHGSTEMDATVSGYHLGWAIGIALLVGAAVIAASTLRPKKEPKLSPATPQSAELCSSANPS
ncbi:MFS transporter [Antrihabitans cavernicola]|uniref:MFS transporter n=1 Tax=Antrihabitans cavernicola TaxID=2495913 RepID=A0A5A7S8T1_9NOCA|nr:MFS transporter [Spelaeibacter cavernicola]KAA0020186.1 MFS transporter [Spelaeibacter cavernicola]